MRGLRKNPLPAQFCLHKALKLPGVKAAGEGEIVTVAGVGDVPLGTPAANRPVEVPQDQIGNGRGTGRPLGQSLVVIAQHREKDPQRLCVDRSWKGRFLHSRIKYAAEKIPNVQLQNQWVSRVGSGVAQRARAAAVGGGIGGDGQKGQKAIRNAALDGFEERVRHGEMTHRAVPLGQLRRMIVPGQAVADGVQGLDGKTQIPGQGLRFPVDDHGETASFPARSKTNVHGSPAAVSHGTPAVCCNTAKGLA